MKRTSTVFLCALIFLACMTSGCDPSEQTTMVSSSTPDTVKTIPSQNTLTVSEISTSSPSSTKVEGTPGFIPSKTPDSTPLVVLDGPILSFTSWENNSTFVYGINIGCFDQEAPCFGEMKTLFEIPNIEILDAQWSLEGNKLAFLGRYESDAETFFDIFTIDDDGDNLMNITNVQEIDSGNEFQTIAQNPRWSPDGITLAYNLCNLGCKVFATNILTNETIQLLEKLLQRDNARFGDIRLGGWSPSQDRLVLVIYDVNGILQIYTGSLSGDDLLQITNTVENNYSASYSPDGTWLLINRASSPDYLLVNSDLFLVPLIGADEVKLTGSEMAYYQPKWSLDGHWVAVRGGMGIGTDQIFLIDISGRSFALDLDVGEFNNPSWKPISSP